MMRVGISGITWRWEPGDVWDQGWKGGGGRLEHKLHHQVRIAGQSLFKVGQNVDNLNDFCAVCDLNPKWTPVAI
jgi:hypothetical protein